ncbi:hypothetical protein ACLIMP_03830 [Novosphingobium aerophilum]|uniref:hypothetical protein n=1 Tax=Novosphingobium TaxID=165696 RepID=UPI002D779E34|nr:hypothetical protein [Novosphingobium sp. RL4]WRT93402.1 hypothetical protein U9J33_02510 [Novosphingobium sp. RL4]
MEAEATRASKGGMKTGLLLACCVTVLALPSAVLAFTTNFKTAQTEKSVDSLDPETSPENLSRAIAMRSLAKGQPFPFTPAAPPGRLERAVTVAVRFDPEAAKAIIVRNRLQIARTDKDVGPLRIAPNAFNLGVARGYQNFAPETAPQALGKGLSDAPELKKFSLQAGTVDQKESRFSPRISIDEKHVAGRAPRTFSGEAGEVDLGGAYRVTENLDVTAGLRYSQERERLVPLTDGRQDSQAVYVGTQFRF